MSSGQSALEQRLSAADKNVVVDRRRARPGDESRSIVRRLRSLEQDTSASRPSAYDAETLRHYCETTIASRPGAVVLAALATLLVQFTLPWQAVVMWGSCAMAIVPIHSRLAANILNATKLNLASAHRQMLVMQLAHGFLWTLLFALHPKVMYEGIFPVVVFGGAITLMGLTVLSAHCLRLGTVATIAPVAIAVAFRLFEFGDKPTYFLAVILLVAVGFFHYLAGRMRDAYSDHLVARAERDGLIAELEQARSISDEARRRAEESNLAKSRFLATMSHELRTPLNAVLGFSEIMVGEVMGPMGNDSYRDYAQDIHASGTHLLKLINEILDLSRVEAGRYELIEEYINIAAVVEDCHQMVRLRAAQKGVTLILQLQSSLPMLWADERSMRQIVLNLLSNAIKFTPQGGTVWLRVGWTDAGGQYVEIQDNGPGIPEDEIDHVLQAFGQGSIAIKSAEQGTGLGLPIVKALVSEHDGHFKLTSKLREGTRAIAIFPRKRVLEELPAVPQTEGVADLGKRRSRYRSAA